MREPARLIGADVGGTFTDVVYLDRNGMLMCTKTPSSRDRSGSATLEGFDALREQFSLSSDDFTKVIHSHSSTIATNAIIERVGAKVGLLVTEGFRDVLELQRLRVAEPMRYDSTRAVPLVPRSMVAEIKGRLTAHGDVRNPLDETSVRQALSSLVDQGAEILVVCLMHSHVSPVHERQVRKIAGDMQLDVPVQLSSDLWPQSREYERAVLAVMNAYLDTIVSGYLDRIAEGVRERQIDRPGHVLRSNGGLTKFPNMRQMPVAMMLSGPAGGVAGAAFAAREVGGAKPNLLTLDMGGTSADVGFIQNGIPVLSSDEHVAGLPLLIPTVAVSSIGAGGGSVIWLDASGALRVGPRSLSADPGPACYGNPNSTGEPALTDAFLVAGWMADSQELGGSVRLSYASAHDALAKLGEPLDSSAEEIADGAIAVAISSMVKEMQTVLARRGLEPPDCSLEAFGGAGPLVGALIAEELGISEVIVPPLPGATSAYGATLAKLESDFVLALHRDMRTLETSVLGAAYDHLRDEAQRWTDEEAIDEEIDSSELRWTLDMRYVGQGYDITVEVSGEWIKTGDMASINNAFHKAHEDLYGHAHPADPAFLSLVRLHGAAKIAGVNYDRNQVGLHESVLAGGEERTRIARISGRETTVRVLPRGSVGTHLSGPAVIEQLDTTIFIPPGWRVESFDSGSLLLRPGH